MTHTIHYQSIPIHIDTPNITDEAALEIARSAIESRQGTGVIIRFLIISSDTVNVMCEDTAKPIEWGARFAEYDQIEEGLVRMSIRRVNDGDSEN